MVSMVRLSSVCLLLLWVVPLVAAPPEVPAEPIRCAAGEDVQVTIRVASGKEGAFRAAFDSQDCIFFRGYERPGSGEMNFLIRPKRNGDFRVIFWTVGEADSSVLVVRAGDVPPTPIPPIPPGPGPVPPGPTPPGPTPPSPIPGDGFRVLVVEESADRSKLPPGQREAMFDSKVREYLRMKCIKGPDGVTPEFRIFDQHDDLNNENPNWKAAMQLPRQSLPWVIISTKNLGSFSGPVPESPEKFLALLRQYGGA